jgi:hypothetical protein
VWAGLCTGLAIVIKPIGVSGALLCLSWMAVVRPGWRAFALGLAALGVFPLLSLLHGALVDFDGYWASFVDRRLLAYSIVASGADSQLGKLWGTLGDVGAASAPGFAGVILLACSRERKPLTFALLWIVSSIAGMSLGGEWHRHYLLQWLPPLCFSLGVGWAALESQYARIAGAAALATSLAIFASSESRFWSMDPDEVSFQLYHRPPYLVSDQVAAHVREHTAPNEPIYVAFAQAELYFLSQCKAAVPQFFFREVEYSRELFEQVAQSIRARAPASLIWTGQIPRWITRDGFAALLRDPGYVPDRAFGPVYVFRRDSTQAALDN